MTAPAYYNEFNEEAAEWLRNLIAAGLIAPGVVDTRSIEDVLPGDLTGFAQCHFFAGIGGWSLALRAAGWPDDRPVWTGSCPCQPFSAAGEGAGFADERHLWPAFHHLIKICGPADVLGEQVASRDADPWIDLVHADMEALGYAFGAIPFPSASVGAPHIRDRLYWMANANGRAGGKGRSVIRGRADRGDAQPRAGSGSGIVPGGMGDADHARLEGHAGDGGAARRQGQERPVTKAGVSGGMGSDGQPGATNGIWSGADWLFCRDAKWRPVEAGTFPLAYGLPRSVGSGGAGVERLAGMAGLDNASLARAKSYRVAALRGYGNAINPEQAAIFVRAVMEQHQLRGGANG